MKEKGSTVGFFISKFAIFLAVILLLGAITVSYKGYKRTIHRKEIKTYASQLAQDFRIIDCLPGYFRLERDLHSINNPHNLIITGNYKDYQVISIQIRSEKNFKKTLLLSEKINGGNFRIERKNPVKIIISKDNRTSLEML